VRPREPHIGVGRGRNAFAPVGGADVGGFGNGEDLLAGGGRARLPATAAFEPQLVEAAGRGMASQRGGGHFVEAVAADRAVLADDPLTLGSPAADGISVA